MSVQAEREPEEQPKPPLRIPCTDWGCKKEHEWLRVGITRADYHLIEKP